MTKISCAVQYILCCLSVLYTVDCHLLTPRPDLLPSSSLLFGNHWCVFYVYESVCFACTFSLGCMYK